MSSVSPVPAPQLTLEPESPRVLNAYPVNEEVVEATHVYGPNDTIQITDPDFVPEGFHENCMNEDGSIKVTEKNKHLHRDIDHLARMHKEEGWGSEEGVTYTTHMAKCPDGRAPLIEAVSFLEFREGISLKGRIVCEDGKTMDCDTQNLLKKLETIPDDPRVQGLQQCFQDAIFSFQQGTGDLEPSIAISEKQSERGGIPVGKYKKKEKERVFRKDVDCPSMFTLCDEPTCCLMNHVMLGVCGAGMLPPPVKETTMKYFKERPMYKHEDLVNGNFDICYLCLKKAASSE